MSQRYASEYYGDTNLLAKGDYVTDIPRTNLALYLRADSLLGVVSDGGTITTWSDDSGNGWDGSAAGSPTFHENVVNGHSVVRFNNGSTDYFTFGNMFSGATSGHFFVVVKIDTTGGGNGGWYMSGDSSNSTHYTWTSNVIYDGWGSTARKTTSAPSLNPSTAFRVYEVESSSGNWVIRINNSTHYSTASNTVGFNTAPLFGKSVGAYYLDGDVAEIIAYSSALTSGDRATVYDHLKNRFNI